MNDYAFVSAVDRVAARQQIEMVNMIFDAMLRHDEELSPNEEKQMSQTTEDQKQQVVEEVNGQEDNKPAQSGSGTNSPEFLENQSLSSQDNDGSDLSTPAVHIFLYFIQVCNAPF